MTRLPRTLEYVALVRAGHRTHAHAHLAYLMGPGQILLNRPLERLDAPGVVWGWCIWDTVEDLWASLLPAPIEAVAPLLPAPIEAVAPDGMSVIEPTAALYHMRYADQAAQDLVAGYAVTRMRQGAWVEIVDRDVWLASLGLRVMPEVGPDEQAARTALLDAADAAELAVPAPTLGACRALLQPRIDAILDASGLTPPQIRALYGVRQGLGEYLAGSST